MNSLESHEMAAFSPKEYWLMQYRSRILRQKNERILARFETFAKIDSTQLLTDAFKRLYETKGVGPPLELENMLVRFYQHLCNDELLSESSAQTYFNTIRSFFRANRLPLRALPKTLAVDGASYATARVLTQDEVRAMVESRKKIVDKLIIAFLAQTGQREQVLPALTHDMIRRFNTMNDKSSTHGIVDVSREIRDWTGKTANKYRASYRFVIGQDTMRLLDSLRSSGEFAQKEWVAPLDWRKIIRTVEGAAKDAGIQRVIRRKSGKMFEIHPHSLRVYFKSRMYEATVPDFISEFMMGHKPRHGGTYDRAALKDENLLKAYALAEPFLSISPLAT
jgi:integrase